MLCRLLGAVTVIVIERVVIVVHPYARRALGSAVIGGNERSVVTKFLASPRLDPFARETRAVAVVRVDVQIALGSYAIASEYGVSTTVMHVAVATAAMLES